MNLLPIRHVSAVFFFAFYGFGLSAASAAESINWDELGTPTICLPSPCPRGKGLSPGPSDGAGNGTMGSGQSGSSGGGYSGGAPISPGAPPVHPGTSTGPGQIPVPGMRVQDPYNGQDPYAGDPCRGDARCREAREKQQREQQKAYDEAVNRWTQKITEARNWYKQVREEEAPKTHRAWLDSGVQDFHEFERRYQELGPAATESVLAIAAELQPDKWGSADDQVTPQVGPIKDAVGAHNAAIDRFDAQIADVAATAVSAEDDGISVADAEEDFDVTGTNQEGFATPPDSHEGKDLREVAMYRRAAEEMVAADTGPDREAKNGYLGLARVAERYADQTFAHGDTEMGNAILEGERSLIDSIYGFTGFKEVVSEASTFAAGIIYGVLGDLPIKYLHDVAPLPGYETAWAAGQFVGAGIGLAGDVALAHTAAVMAAGAIGGAGGLALASGGLLAPGAVAVATASASMVGAAGSFAPGHWDRARSAWQNMMQEAEERRSGERPAAEHCDSCKVGERVDSPVRHGEEVLEDLKSGQTSVGKSGPRIDYRQTFFDHYPETEGKVVVHHAVERRVLKQYPGLFTLDELNSIENLRGIPIETNSSLHLSEIRKLWNAFYRAHPSVTSVSRQDVLDHVRRIDDIIGSRCLPPVRIK